MTIERMMAHQWFGNLVTPIWWDFAWLSEGFATYFAYFNTAKVTIIVYLYIIFDTTADFNTNIYMYVCMICSI